MRRSSLVVEPAGSRSIGTKAPGQMGQGPMPRREAHMAERAAVSLWGWRGSQ